MNRAFVRATVLTLGITTGVAGCQNAPLCTNCPDLTGTWNVTFSNDTSTGDCASFGVGDEGSQVINVTQNGSTVNTDLYGFALTGSLLQSGHMTLTGSNILGDGGANDFASLNFDASISVPGGTNQTLMTGTVTGDFQDDSTTCTLDRDFTALQ